jgi:NAD+ synthase (glutamine-hydrolysing)
VNQIGGNDELVFDGASMSFDRAGNLTKVLPSFTESLVTIDVGEAGDPELQIMPRRVETVYKALVLGVRDYMKKCGFHKAVVGVSGGLDSSVVASIAAEAIGSKNVLGISMPSPYTLRGSVEDARTLAQNLGIRCEVLRISSIFNSYLRTLEQNLGFDTAVDVALENIQARIRGNLLMAVSNRLGYLVLSTGNKSELAVGYCTLYGDMTGGLAVISDVPKTMVYELAHYINEGKEVIPQNIIEKAPSAELKPDQRDQDTLPPYEILDRILHYYMEDGQSADEIKALGFDAETVEWVVRAVQKSEYKRRQAPPGLKVTTRAFGIGRRMPIAAKHV